MTQAFAILSSTTFGPFSRYRLDECRDRFGGTVFMVLDAETMDPATGLPAVIRQEQTREAAVRGLGGE